MSLTTQGVAKTAPARNACGQPDADGGRANLDAMRHAVDQRLHALLPSAEQTPEQLYQAMKYSLLAPGKRLRPLLTLMTAHHFGLDTMVALDAACAVEMVHTASLIIDDLPAMDDSSLRRGLPTTHRVFGDDIAILAAVALLNQAYTVIGSAEGLRQSTRTKLVCSLAHSVGANGIIGGQVIDLKERGSGIGAKRLETMNRLKTAALFVAAVEAGAIVAKARGAGLKAARKFATRLGLAFQIADDLLDDPRYAGHTGKDTGKDKDKPTVVSLLGRERARALLAKHIADARSALFVMSATASPLTDFFEANFSCFEERLNDVGNREAASASQC